MIIRKTVAQLMGIFNKIINNIEIGNRILPKYNCHDWDTKRKAIAANRSQIDAIVPINASSIRNLWLKMANANIVPVKWLNIKNVHNYILTMNLYIIGYIINL